MTTLTPNSQNIDVVSVLVGVATEAIKGVTELSTKVDFIQHQMEGQETKLDGLLIGMSNLNMQTSNLTQSVDSMNKSILDHENRLRILEPRANKAEETERDLREFKTEFERFADKNSRGQEATQKDIQDMKREITRYGAMAGVILFIVQFILTVFIAPWLQGLIR